MFEFLAQILDFFYGLVPNYAIAIMLMTLLVMIITTPLTLKGTRSMIKMQLLQPELKKIQEKHKGGDRNEMNQELMAFYQENDLNPLGGCFPLLVQAPVFFILFRLIRGLTHVGADGTFDPQYLDHSSTLYRALHGQKQMLSFGFDLAQSTSDAVGQSIVHGLPYLALILLMVAAQYLQQKQISARNTNQASAMPQQQMLLKVMPAFFAVISIGFPAALVIYWVTSSVYRIGLQGYITKSLYGHEDSIGAQASKAAAEARKMKEQEKKDKAGGGSKGGGTGGTRSSKGSSAAGNGKAPDADPPGKYQPSSKKKKRKRR